MKIEKAIEVLGVFRQQESALLGEEYAQATALGIEALKRVKQCRFPPYGLIEDTLPGETRADET